MLAAPLRAIAAAICISILAFVGVWLVAKGWLNYEGFTLFVGLGATILLFLATQF